jgi:hypothetical protein
LSTAKRAFLLSVFRDSEPPSPPASVPFLASKSSAIARQREGLYRSKSKDKRKSMEDGRYGTFTLKIEGFISDLGRPEADFLRFVYNADARSKLGLKFSGVIHA